VIVFEYLWLDQADWAHRKAHGAISSGQWLAKMGSLSA
jgi:hypothetical protein